MTGFIYAEEEEEVENMNYKSEKSLDALEALLKGASSKDGYKRVELKDGHGSEIAAFISTMLFTALVAFFLLFHCSGVSEISLDSAKECITRFGNLWILDGGFALGLAILVAVIIIIPSIVVIIVSSKKKKRFKERRNLIYNMGMNALKKNEDKRNELSGLCSLMEKELKALKADIDKYK